MRDDTTYRELTLEFLGTIKLKRGMISFYRVNTFQFQLSGVMYHMILIEFFVHLGLFDEVFTQTTEYDALLIEQQVEESLKSC